MKRWVSPLLPELSLLDDLDEIAKQYSESFGRLPIDVSHWDPSPEFGNQLRKITPISQNYIDPIPYRFSYYLDNIDAVKEKLGFSDKMYGALVLENGSSAVSSAVNWLMIKGIRQVTVLMPCYFTIPYNLLRHGLEIIELSMERTKKGFQLPSNLMERLGDALWITNPVYNTGVYMSEDDLIKISAIIKSGTPVIVDEALAYGSSIFKEILSDSENFLGIYTPHKSICVNGMKFSIVICHKSQESILNHWADVVSGGISVSALNAINHFSSDSFDMYANQFHKKILDTREWHNGLCQSLSGHVETDLVGLGHFSTVYFQKHEASLGYNVDFLKSVINDTGCRFIPGIRSGFNSPLPFCFRVNLSRDSTKFRTSLRRLYHYLSDI